MARTQKLFTKIKVPKKDRIQHICKTCGKKSRTEKGLAIHIAKKQCKKEYEHLEEELE